MRVFIYSNLAAAAISFAIAGPALPQAAMTDGEVTKVDMPAEKVTLRHGPIKNLEMDGMTMIFGVKDKSMLKGVKVGDKVKFRAEKINGQITVVEMRKGK